MYVGFVMRADSIPLVRANMNHNEPKFSDTQVLSLRSKMCVINANLFSCITLLPNLYY